MEGGSKFPCSNCGKVFGRKQHLTRHEKEGICTRAAKKPKKETGGVLEGDGRSEFNLHRRMVRACGPFLGYTRALVTLQSQFEGGPVDFIPLGGGAFLVMCGPWQSASRQLWAVRVSLQVPPVLLQPVPS